MWEDIYTRNCGLYLKVGLERKNESCSKVNKCRKKLPLRDLPKTVMKPKQNNEKAVICPQATLLRGKQKTVT